VIEGEAVLLDLHGRHILGLNATGSFVWGLLDGRRTVAQVGEEVAVRFRVDAGRAAADVRAFLSVLLARDLVAV